MELPNKFPPTSKGWRNIEAMKWLIEWEKVIADAKPDERRHSDFNKVVMPKQIEFLEKMSGDDLTEMLHNLMVHREVVDELVTILLASVLAKGQVPKGETLTKVVDDIFSHCGVPKPGKEDL